MAENIIRLKLESGEYDSKIKRAAQGLQRMAQECHNAGGMLTQLEDENRKFIQGLGRFETVSKTARGSLGELTSAFIDLKHTYNQLSSEEKNSEFGRELSRQLDVLKGRVLDAKKEVGSMTQELSGSKFGQFGSFIDTLGQKMGITGNITEMLTSKTALLTSAVGAGIAVVTKATDAWVKYNRELDRQDQQTQVITGLNGAGADAMTDAARALVDTYDVDFRQAIEAANTLMTQFGESGTSAIGLLREGMQGMIQGDGPKLLQMIQQYAPAFRDAGVSASQLIAVIQNSEGGIFTAENMNAIVMGIKNIRLMTKQTSEALERLGIDGQEMARKMSDGSMTVFDALKQVAAKLKECEAGSQTAGEVLQRIFGRQGAMAGQNLAKAIEELNLNLKKTKKQTGELGDAYDDLYKANVKLNHAIRDCFEYDGWDQMATGIKSKLVGALAAVLQKIGDIKGELVGFSANRQQGEDKNGGGAFIDRAVDRLKGGWSKGRQSIYDQQVQAYSNQILSINDKIRETQAKVTEDLEGNMAFSYYKELRNLENRKKAIQRNLDEYIRRAEALKNAPTVKNTGSLDDSQPTSSGSKPTKASAKANTIDYAADSISAQQAEIQRLTKLWQNAGAAVRDDYKLQLESAQKVLDVMTGKAKLTDITIKVDSEAAIEEIKSIEGVTIDPKTFTVTAETEDALLKLQKVQGVVIGDKQFEIKPIMPTDIMPFKINDPFKGLQTMQKKIQLDLKADQVKVDENTLKSLMKDAIQNGIDGMDFQFAILGDKIGKGIDIPDSAWQGIIDEYNALREQIGMEPITIDLKAGSINDAARDAKTATRDFSSAANAIAQMGSAMASIEDPTAKVMGIVAQAIATVAQAFASALASDTTTKGNVWAFIGAAAASVASMVTTIQAIHSATGYAEGGVVKGTTYSNDQIPAYLNAGETVLTRAQSGILSEILDGDGGSSQPAYVHVSGEQLLIPIFSTLKRKGQNRGEYIKIQ